MTTFGCLSSLGAIQAGVSALTSPHAADLKFRAPQPLQWRRIFVVA
jgi:hypothetical protein